MNGAPRSYRKCIDSTKNMERDGAISKKNWKGKDCNKKGVKIKLKIDFTALSGITLDRS